MTPFYTRRNENSRCKDKKKSSELISGNKCSDIRWSSQQEARCLEKRNNLQDKVWLTIAGRSSCMNINCKFSWEKNRYRLISRLKFFFLYPIRGINVQRCGFYVDECTASYWALTVHRDLKNGMMPGLHGIRLCQLPK